MSKQKAIDFYAKQGVQTLVDDLTVWIAGKKAAERIGYRWDARRASIYISIITPILTRQIEASKRIMDAIFWK